MNRKRKQQEAYVAGILRKSDGILLVRRRKGDRTYWSLPIGKIELRETPQIALKRIVWAETGILVEPTQVVNSIHSDIVNTKTKAIHRLSSVFFVKKVGGEVREEVAKFMKLRNLHGISLNERSRYFLKSAH
jgi:ADP-ribose pyrophosphatase YjhB (NUDIX family)